MQPTEVMRGLLPYPHPNPEPDEPPEAAQLDPTEEILQITKKALNFYDET